MLKIEAFDFENVYIFKNEILLFLKITELRMLADITMSQLSFHIFLLLIYIYISLPVYYTNYIF